MEINLGDQASDSTPAIVSPNPTPATSNTTTPTGASIPVTPAAPATPATPAAPAAPPVSTKSYYKIGNDIYDAGTNQKVPDVATFEKNYYGAKQVSAPSQQPAGGTQPPAGGTQPPAGGTQPPAGGTTDNTSKISAALAQGLDNPQDIANQLGLNVKDVQDALNGDENLSYQMSLNQNNNQIQQALTDYQNKTTAIMNGSFELTDDEKAQIAGVQSDFDTLKTQQANANAAQLGSMQIAAARSGALESNSGGVSDETQNDISNGLQKIADLDTKAASQISTIKQAIEKQDYDEVTTQYNNLQKALDDKTTAINALHTATQKAVTDQAAAIKADLDNQKLK